MSRRKTERLLSLVVCLLSAGRYLTALQIREAVPGYPESFDAFKRMFERDKDELRELGIPLQTGPAAGEEEIGYRIMRTAYELPEIRLEPDEAAILGLAARVWHRAALDRAAAGALLKLRAAGIDLEPWGVVNRHGRWYVAGHDSDRKAVRVFRLSRIEGPVTFLGPAGAVTVPEGTDVREIVREWDAMPPARRTAALRVRRGAGSALRHRALSERPDGEGWDLVEVAFSDPGWFGEHLASFGSDVVVVDPVDLREAVIGQLKGSLA